MNLIQPKQIDGLYQFMVNNIGGTDDGSLISAANVFYLTGEQEVIAGKTFRANITGTAGLVWESGIFQNLEFNLITGNEIISSTANIGGVSISSAGIIADDATFSGRIIGNEGFFITGSHDSSEDCQIKNTTLYVYSDNTDSLTRPYPAAVFGKHENIGPSVNSPELSIYSYKGNETDDAPATYNVVFLI